MWLSDLGLCLRAVRKEAGSKTKLKRRKKKRENKKAIHARSTDRSGKILFPRQQLRAESSLRGRRTAEGGRPRSQLLVLDSIAENRQERYRR